MTHVQNLKSENSIHVNNKNAKSKDLAFLCSLIITISLRLNFKYDYQRMKSFSM